MISFFSGSPCTIQHTINMSPAKPRLVMNDTMKNIVKFVSQETIVGNEMKQSKIQRNCHQINGLHIGYVTLAHEMNIK